MLKEFTEPALRLLQPDVTIARIETEYESGASLKTLLSSLDVSVEKTTPSPEAIQILNAADIANYQKLDILLAALGEKPASQISLEPEKGASTVSDSQILALHAVTTALNLYTIDENHTLHSSNPEDDITVRSFYISRSPDNAAMLQKAFWSRKETDELITGKVLGFPDTSVIAFITQQDLMPIFNRTYETVEDDAFTVFRMSTKNLEEEMKTVRRWAAATKAADKPLYDTLIKISSK